MDPMSDSIIRTILLVALLPGTMHAHPLQGTKPDLLSTAVSVTPAPQPAMPGISSGYSPQETLPQPVDSEFVSPSSAPDFSNHGTMGDTFIPSIPETYDTNVPFEDIIQINSYYSRRMLDILNRQTDKQLLVLSNVFESGSPSLVVGGTISRFLSGRQYEQGE